MKSIAVLALSTTLAASVYSFGAQASGQLSQQQLQALGFQNQNQAEDSLNIVAASLDDVTDTAPSSRNLDVIWPSPSNPLPPPTPAQGANLPPGQAQAQPPGSSIGTGGQQSSPTNAPAPGTQSWNAAINAITGLDIEGWIAIGQTVTRIITANQPVVSLNNPSISILPQSQPNWSMMSGWGAPVVRRYQLSFYNAFKQAVVSIPYSITFNANGGLNGAGRYIANLRAVVEDMSVSWMYSVDMTTVTHDAVNTGTVANPIPGVTFDVQVKVHTYIKDKQVQQQFFITGDGKVKNCSAGECN